MRFILAFVLIFVESFSCWGQKHVCIVETINKEGYQYIPRNVFADSVDGVWNSFSNLDSVKNKQQMVISWSSVYIDGSYNIAITPEQIFLYSGHENPNPNRLYWVMDINRTQYQNIFIGLIKDRRLDKNYSDSYYRIKFNGEQRTDFPAWWKDGATDSVYTAMNTKTLRQHLIKYFTDLNRYIPPNIRKINLPSTEDVNDSHSKLYSSSKEELKEWVGRRKRK